MPVDTLAVLAQLHAMCLVGGCARVHTCAVIRERCWCDLALHRSPLVFSPNIKGALFLPAGDVGASLAYPGLGRTE